MNKNPEPNSRFYKLRHDNLVQGLPAVALIVAAFVLLAWGFFIVRPKVPQRYREQSNRALVAAGILEGSTGEFSEANKRLSSDELRIQVDRGQICLTRLLSLQPHDAVVRYQLGQLADASSKLSRKSAYVLRGVGEQAKADKAESRFQSDRNFAKETMETVAEMEAPEANQAKAWLLMNTFESPIREARELEQLDAILSSVIEAQPDNPVALGHFAQIRIQQAFALDRDLTVVEREKFETVLGTVPDGNVGSNLTVAEREKLVREAIDAILKIKSPSMVDLAYLAEAQDALDVEASLETTLRATQEFWLKSDSTRNTPEQISAMFSCLYRLGNAREAKGMIDEKVPKLSAKDRSILSVIHFNFYLRNIVCQFTFQAPGRRVSGMNALSLAVRTDVRSPKLLGLLQQVVLNEESNHLARSINASLEQSDDQGLKHLVSGFRSAFGQEWTNSRAEIQQALRFEGNLAVAGVFLAIRMVDEKVAPVSFAVRFMEQLAREASDSTQLWLARALFCEKHGELETSAESLERVLDKAQNNAPILDKLESLYTRLGKTEDVARIQQLKSKARSLKEGSPG